MSDTIDLLEAIGRDATLRHASTKELTHMLEQAKASDALTSAVVLGDSTQLFVELGHRPMSVPQVVQTQTPGHEDEDPEEGEAEPEDLSGHTLSSSRD
jgi:hypothetical protein